MIFELSLEDELSNPGDEEEGGLSQERDHLCKDWKL